MSTFPPRMKFPQESLEPIKLCERQPKPPFDFCKRFTCEGHTFLTIVSKQHESFISCGNTYYFAATHLIIPKYFSKVDVDHKTGQVLNESNPPLGVEINGLFAVGLREVKESQNFTLHGKNALFDRGSNNCGLPTFSKVISPTKEVSENGKVNFITNTHQLFFKFQQHYFTPIILSNGMACYYIFERKQKIRDLMKLFNSNKESEIQINRPITMNNILRVPVTRKIWVFDQQENQLKK